MTDVRAEIEKALDVAAQVAENPLAQSALGVVAVPPRLLAGLGQFLQMLDEHLMNVAPAPAAAAAPDPTTTAVPLAAASSPADVPQPAAVSGHSESIDLGDDPDGDNSEADPKAPSPSPSTDIGGLPGITSTAPSAAVPFVPSAAVPFVPPQVGPPVA